MVSIDWRTRFSQAGVLHLSAGNFDHAPILICSVLDHPSRPKLFRFFEAWTRDSSCENIIKEAWLRCDPRKGRFSFANKIRTTTKALKDWNQNSFRLCQSRVAELEEQLRIIQGLEPTDYNLAKEKDV